MRRMIGCALGLLCSSAALAEPGSCPRWEAGARYPWQSNIIMRGDLYGWVIMDVDRYGAPASCRIGKNNFLDVETGKFLCKNYSERWRGPKAAPSEPNRRVFTRYALIAGYDHLIADKKARKLWFKDHPGERPECYPEPTRPDRLL
ncbi:MAG TPA: hypothetical protein VF079_06540 [Sphingomicrobium sp.]